MNDLPSENILSNKLFFYIRLSIVPPSADDIKAIHVIRRDWNYFRRWGKVNVSDFRKRN